MITFRFLGRSPTPGTAEIGMETDQQAETLRFILPQIADDQSAQLLMILPDGTPEALNIVDGLAVVPAAVCAVPGRIRAWVEILSNETSTAWNSEMLNLDVGDLPPISEEVERQFPTALQHAIALGEYSAQAARDVAAERKIIQESIAGANASARQIIEDAQEAGHAMPYGAGGTEGQYLRKKSASDFDAEWVDADISTRDISSGDFNLLRPYNAYRTIYYGSDISQFTNKPLNETSPYPFVLEVFALGPNQNYLRQILHVYSTSAVIYKRQYYLHSDSLVWSEWQCTSHPVLTISCGTISSLPATINDTRITVDMVVTQAVLGNPSAQMSDWSVTTNTGSLTVSGTINGATSLDLYLCRAK